MPHTCCLILLSLKVFYWLCIIVQTPLCTPAGTSTGMASHGEAGWAGAPTAHWPTAGRHGAQEVERGGLVTGRLLVRSPGSPERRGVPGKRRRTLTAPDELGCRLAWLTPPSVCDCAHERLNGSICKAL